MNRAKVKNVLNKYLDDDWDSPLQQAVDADGYEWMQENQPNYLRALEEEIELGKTPEQIRTLASRELGPDRSGLVLRCFQVARHLYRQEAAAKEIIKESA